MICPGRHQPEIAFLPLIVMVMLLLWLCAFPCQPSAAGTAISRTAMSQAEFHGEVRTALNGSVFDLSNFLEDLASESTDGKTKRLCQRASEVITSKLIIYEQHTADCRSNGISIY